MLQAHKAKLDGIRTHPAFSNSRKLLIGTTLAEGIIAEAENLESQGCDKVAIFAAASHALAILGAAHMQAIATEDAASKTAKPV